MQKCAGAALTHFRPFGTFNRVSKNERKKRHFEAPLTHKTKIFGPKMSLHNFRKFVSALTPVGDSADLSK